MYVSFSYSANQILGKPDVYPRYGTIAGAWAQADGQLDRVHFIEASFILILSQLFDYLNFKLPIITVENGTHNNLFPLCFRHDFGNGCLIQYS